MPIPSIGQKDIPIRDWKRFLRVADWYERTVEQGKGVLASVYGRSLVIKTPAAGIAARDGSTMSSATCIQCIGADAGTAGEKTLHETNEELVVYNSHLSAIPGDVYVKTTLSPNGTRYVDGSAGDLQKFQIVGNHPGKDTVFDLYLGTWDPATDDYIYDCGTTFKGIDHYNGVPYPTAYPQGHGLWKPSDTYGKIIDVVSLDCEGPGIDCPA